MTSVTLARVLGLLVVLKAVELALLLSAPWWVAAGLAVSGVATFLSPRMGSTAIAVTTLALLVGGYYSNHMTLVMWVATTLAVFGDDSQQRFVLRCQLAIMYLFAATAKLWPSWLTGGAIATTWVGPFLPPRLIEIAAWATILVEFALALGVWSRQRFWLWMAVATHLAIFIFSIRTLRGSFIQLLIFNGLAAALWFRAHRSLWADEPRQRAAWSTIDAR